MTASSAVLTEPEPAPVKNGKIKREPFTERDQQRLLALVAEGKSYAEIARQMGRAQSIITRWAHNLGRPKDSTKVRGHVSRKDLGVVNDYVAFGKQVVKLRREGLTRAKIAAQFHVSTASVDRALKRVREAGVNADRPARITQSDLSQIERLYQNGMKIDKIAEIAGLSKATVYARLKANGIVLRSVSVNGKHRLSADAKASIAQAQRERWRRQKQEAREKLLASQAPDQPIPTIARRNGYFQCPECRAKYKFAQHLGRHRSAQHGIQSANMLALQSRSEVQPQPPNHREEIHVSNPSHNPDDEISKHTIYVFGGLEKEARIYAEQHEIPWKIFASGLAELFQLATGRRLMGPHRSMPALPRTTSA